MNERPEFKPFPKLARLSRDIIITEKLDGTNASVLIAEDGQVFAGSRTRWVTPEADNYGFAKWVDRNKDELLTLGPGHHFGEYWGLGIQSGYGLKEKRFSLFNAIRWCLHGQTPQLISNPNALILKYQDVLPECVGLVPTLYKGPFTTTACDDVLKSLEINGSVAAPGFFPAEGICVFHIASNAAFKKTLGGDGHKGETKS